MIDMLANVTEWMMETPPTAPPRRYGRYKKKNECCDDNDRDSKFCWLRKVNQKQPSGRKRTKQQSHMRNWMQDTVHLGVVSSASCIWPVCVCVYVVCWDCCLIWWKKRIKKKEKTEKIAQRPMLFFVHLVCCDSEATVKTWREKAIDGVC